MKDNENKALPQDDEKIDVGKSVFQNIREMNEQKLAEERERKEQIEREIAAAEKRRQEEYDRQILEDKKELMRLKQGVIEESETIHEEHEEAVKLTPWQAFRNFIYHNKWWLIMALLLAVVAGILIKDMITKPRPDVIVLVVCDNDELGNAKELQEYFESFAEDYNGNGNVLVSVYYIPLSDDSYRNYNYGTDTKLTVELQSADSIIVIGGELLIKAVDARNVFVDLKSIYPDDDRMERFALKLSRTDFAEKIGVSPEAVTDDLFMAVRKPIDLMYCDAEDMQKTYDKDFPVFERIIADLGSNQK